MGWLWSRLQLFEPAKTICFQVVEFMLKTHNYCRVARFFLVHDTKTGKMYQMNTKCTKCSSNIPNVRKMFQIGTSNRDFLYESKPSGNPEI
jgi:hypothetical protein